MIKLQDKSIIIGCLYSTHNQKTVEFQAGHGAVYSTKGLSPTILTMSGG